MKTRFADDFRLRFKQTSADVRRRVGPIYSLLVRASSNDPTSRSLCREAKRVVLYSSDPDDA